MTNNTPDTVSELLSMNQPEKTQLEKVADVMSETGYDDTLTTVKWLLNNLKDFHHERVLEFLKEGDTDKVPAWVQDETKLQMCLDILSDIQ